MISKVNLMILYKIGDIVNRDFWVGIFVLFGLAILLGVYTTLFVGGVTKESVIYHLEAKMSWGFLQVFL